MTVKCETLEEFTTVCAAFVREGVTFKAYTATLIIELTGGY